MALLKTLQAHKARILKVRFNPDKQTFVSASEDGTLKLWNTDGRLIRTFAGHKAPVWSVAFSRALDSLPLPVKIAPLSFGNLMVRCWLPLKGTKPQFGMWRLVPVQTRDLSLQPAVTIPSNCGDGKTLARLNRVFTKP